MDKPKRVLEPAEPARSSRYTPLKRYNALIGPLFRRPLYVLVFLSSSNAIADHHTIKDVNGRPWDPEQSSKARATKIVSAYRSNGMTGLQILISNCYKSVEDQTDEDRAGERFTACAKMDLGAHNLDQGFMKMGMPGADYFSLKNIQWRINRMKQFYPPHAVESSIQRWMAEITRDVNDAAAKATTKK